MEREGWRRRDGGGEMEGRGMEGEGWRGRDGGGGGVEGQNRRGKERLTKNAHELMVSVEPSPCISRLVTLGRHNNGLLSF